MRGYVESRRRSEVSQSSLSSPEDVQTVSKMEDRLTFCPSRLREGQAIADLHRESVSLPHSSTSKPPNRSEEY